MVMIFLFMVLMLSGKTECIIGDETMKQALLVIIMKKASGAAMVKNHP
jgi:hypothetical protein